MSAVEVEVYDKVYRLEERDGKYVLHIGNKRVEAETVEELAQKALPLILHECGDKCSGLEEQVRSELLTSLQDAAERLPSALYQALVRKWKAAYRHVDVIRVDSDKVWLYAHDNEVMIVKEYAIRKGGVGAGKLVYCGPVIVQTPRGYFLFVRNKLAAIVEDVASMAEVLANVAKNARPCYDVDIDDEVAVKVPMQKTAAVYVALRTRFTSTLTGTVDWYNGRDLMGLLRTTLGEYAARAFKLREDVLRKYYGENYYSALATESLYVAAALVHVMKRASKTAVNSWIYVYGPAGLGKSILMRNLTEMWCSTEECEYNYMPYVAGAMNENRLRNALDIEGPPFAADEQNRESVVKLLNMLGSATSDLIGVHASKYGKGFGAVFKVRRAVFIVTNVPASDVLTKVDASLRDAVKRRLVVITWSHRRLDKEAARALIEELRENTVGVLDFVSSVYRRCEDELASASDTLELAKAFWRCASKVYRVDFGERIKALEWVESIQGEEKAQREFDEVHELWTAVKSYYKTADDKEALLKLLDDVTAVAYTHDEGERWDGLFRVICGRSVNVSADNPSIAEVFLDIYQCLYNIQFNSMEEVERYMRRADVELVKKITELRLAGKYPWIVAPSWLVAHKKREVAGVSGISDRRRNIRRYDLFPHLFKLIFVESKEDEESKEERREGLTNEQETLSNTGNTSNTGGSSYISFSLPAEASEGVESVTPSESAREFGVTGVTGVTQDSPGQSSTIIKNDEEYSKCVKETYRRHRDGGLDHAAALMEAIRQCL